MCIKNPAMRLRKRKAYNIQKKYFVFIFLSYLLHRMAIFASWSIRLVAGFGKQKITEKKAVMVSGITTERGASWIPFSGSKLDSAPLNLPKKAVYMIGKK